VQIERKTIAFILKENPRGRFLRISEDAGGRRNAIIIPSTGLAEFQKLLDEMIKASNELPEKTCRRSNPVARIFKGTANDSPTPANGGGDRNPANGSR